METTLAHAEVPLPYEPIKLELKAGDIAEAMSRYMAFLHLPAEQKEEITYFDEQRPRVGRSGYMHKTEADKKHVFHMTKALEQEFALKQHYLPAESRNFLEVARSVFYSVTRSAKEKYQELESELPALAGIHFPRSGKREHHLRFLAYEDPHNGTLAAGHYDKSTGTIAIAESHGGLRLGFKPDNLKAVDRATYDPLFFHSYGWHQLAEMLDIDTSRRAAWHDVIDSGERVNSEVSRWALVYFINPANIYLESTQEQTHTPIPWRGMGKLALRSDTQSFL